MFAHLGRYYAQVNLTATGSSRFGKEADGGVKAFGARWAIFPSVQGSWVLTNEPWLAANGVIVVPSGADITTHVFAKAVNYKEENDLTI